MDDSFATSIARLPRDQQEEIWNIVGSNIRERFLTLNMYMRASVILAQIYRELFIEDMRTALSMPIRFMSDDNIYNIVLSECRRLMADRTRFRLFDLDLSDRLRNLLFDQLSPEKKQDYMNWVASME